MTSTDTGFSDAEIQTSQAEPINQIENRLFLGNIKSRTSEILKLHNIQHVVRITTEMEEARYYYLLPVDINEMMYYLIDEPPRLIIPIIKKAYYVIKRHIEKGRNVLVHCEAGISRSASIIIAYLMIENQMPAEAALKYVETKHKCVWPNPGFFGDS